MRAKVFPGRKTGQLELEIIGDTTDVPERFRSLVLPLGSTRYECKHGVGTASGFYPCAPDRRCRDGLEPGQIVEVLGIAGHLDLPSAPPWARKLFFLNVRVDCEAIAAERAEKEQYARMKEARERFAATANACGHGNPERAQAALKALREWLAIEPEALRRLGIDHTKVEAALAEWASARDRWDASLCYRKYSNAVSAVGALAEGVSNKRVRRAVLDEWYF